MQTQRMNRPCKNVSYSETDEKYLMELALPGIGNKDVNIETRDNLLIVSTGEIKDEKASTFNYFSNTWKYTLPQRADIDKIEAKMKNGILSIEIPLKVVRKSIKVA